MSRKVFALIILAVFLMPGFLFADSSVWMNPFYDLIYSRGKRQGISETEKVQIQKACKKAEENQPVISLAPVFAQRIGVSLPPNFCEVLAEDVLAFWKGLMSKDSIFIGSPPKGATQEQKLVYFIRRVKKIKGSDKPTILDTHLALASLPTKVRAYSAAVVAANVIPHIDYIMIEWAKEPVVAQRLGWPLPKDPSQLRNFTLMRLDFTSCDLEWTDANCNTPNPYAYRALTLPDGVIDFVRAFLRYDTSKAVAYFKKLKQF